MFKYLAHADELHSETTTTAEHWLTEPWVLGLLLLAVIVIWWKGAEEKWRIPGILGILLIAGIASYRISPVVSFVAIAAGFLLALILTLLSIAKK